MVKVRPWPLSDPGTKVGFFPFTSTLSYITTVNNHVAANGGANGGALPIYLRDPYVVLQFMQRSKVELLPSMFHSGMVMSTLWEDEEKTGGLAVTNCLSVCLSTKIHGDAFFIARISHVCGFRLANILGLGEPIDPVPDKGGINIEE